MLIYLYYACLPSRLRRSTVAITGVGLRRRTAVGLLLSISSVVVWSWAMLALVWWRAAVLLVLAVLTLLAVLPLLSVLVVRRLAVASLLALLAVLVVLVMLALGVVWASVPC